jgi:hypothetical protein
VVQKVPKKRESNLIDKVEEAVDFADLRIEMEQVYADCE